MLMTAWNPRPGVLSNLMWIMDRVFKFTNFGIVSVLHKDFFIQAVSFLTYILKILIISRLSDKFCKTLTKIKIVKAGKRILFLETYTYVCLYFFKRLSVKILRGNLTIISNYLLDLVRSIVRVFYTTC